MSIHDVSYTELFDAWQAGNKADVISNLSRRHPAVTALFIVQGAQDGKLKLPEANELANLLMDDLRHVRDNHGLEATQRVQQ